ncbi:Pvc16 family protein [Mesorhizobium sp.]|uniref:Pvc16 family protein n=1 Tax=Mesorhizobium sp. TaxID=1871066 RepID=UPI000FE7D489|nr:Pvc16 family protein [Mesorhizobium sp.]RWO22197.1 MAG: DUF4255 domain-containing protein [Mesorhizobium sp.]
MSANKIRLVTEALRDLIAASGVGLSDIHIGPLDDTLAESARLVLFLYRASVNSELRNAGHRIVPPNPADPIVVHERAIPFDLHFLLTTSPSGEGVDTDGLADLGLAIQAINDAPDLVDPMLGGDVVRLSFEAMPTEEMGRIWSLFPAANYRISVVILATPVWIDPRLPTAPAHPVISEDYRTSHRAQGAGNGF